MPARTAYMLLLTLLCFTRAGYSQCPFPATLTSNGICLGSTLTLNTSASLTQIIWFNGPAVAKNTGDGINVIDPSAKSYTPTAAGSYKVAVTALDGCTITTDVIVIGAIPSLGILPSTVIDISPSNPIIPQTVTLC